MVTFICPTCNQERTGARKRCYPCTKTVLSDKSKAKIAASLRGRQHSPERRAAIAEGKRQQIAADGRVFDLAGYMADKPHPLAVPVGTERVVKDGRVQVKTSDGWRYRSRVVWEAAHGPIPHGRVIHHKDHDPMNDDLANLEMLTRGEHARHHTKERSNGL